jgi:hypothetical protein
MTIKSGLRMISAILLIFMLIPLVAGCSNNNADVKVKVDNVFKTQDINLPEGFQPSGSISYMNDKIYLQGYSSIDYRPVLYSLNKDGSDGKYIELIKDKPNAYIYTLDIRSDGSIMYLYNEYFYDEETYMSTDTSYIVTVDSAGNELMNLNLTEMFRGDEDYFYVSSFVVDGNNNIYLSASNSVIVLDEIGNILFNVELGDNAYINNLIPTNKGDIVAIYYDYSNPENPAGNVLKKIDLNTKSFGEEYDLTNMNSRYLYNIRTSNDENYDFFYNDEISVYGYNIASGVQTEIINWINSDIDNSYSNSFYVVSGDELICAGYNYLKNKNELMLLNRVPEEDIKEKYILTLAAFGLDYNIKSYVIDFNRNNLDYRIQIEDYTKHNTDTDYSLGITKLNTDLISGKIPDILIVNSYNSLPIDNYISKGLFTDLNKFIDDDPEINRADYFENILDASQHNGKLYQIFSQFYIQTVVGKTKFFGNMDGWTLSEYTQFMASQPQGTESFVDMTQGDMLRRYVTMMIDEFIDVNTGKCNFDNEGFIDVLEFAKTFPATISRYEDPNFDHEQYWREMETAYKEDRVVLMDYYLSEFEYFWDTVKVQFNDDITFIGMPTPNKKGSAFQPTSGFMMSSKTKHSDGVWSFIRRFIMDDYFDANQYGGFAIKKSYVEKMADNVVNRANEVSDDGGSITYRDGNYAVAEINSTALGVDQRTMNIRYIDGVEVDIGFLTREYADMIIDLISTVDHVMRYDESMIDIINEEAQGFFAGQKTAQETAKIIQNRLQNYVDERR